MHSSDQNIKTVREMLFDAISSFDCKKVRSLVEQAKQEGNNVAPIMNSAFKKANETRVKQQNTAFRKKLKKIKELLKKELDNIAILSMSNDVETTVSRKEVPVLELEGSKSNSASPSSEDDDFSKLESDDSARISTVLPQSSSLGFANESVNTVISIDNNREEQTSNKPAEYVEQVANENIQPKSVANKQASNSNKIYTKENSVKWPTVATWMFAVTGVLSLAAAPAAYFALGTSLLVAGVAAGIGAFCIVAAIAVHYYNKAPSGPLKGPGVEQVVRNTVVGAS